MYVYMLSDYDEYGAQNVCATLDRNRLMSLVDENWKFVEANNPSWLARGKKGLEWILSQFSDEELSKGDGHDCHEGWGGMQLHVIKLAE